MLHGARFRRFATIKVGSAALVVGLATFSAAMLTAQVAGAANDVVTNCNGSGPGSRLPW